MLLQFFKHRSTLLERHLLASQVNDRNAKRKTLRKRKLHRSDGKYARNKGSIAMSVRIRKNSDSTSSRKKNKERTNLSSFCGSIRAVCHAPCRQSAAKRSLPKQRRPPNRYGPHHRPHHAPPKQLPHRRTSNPLRLRGTWLRTSGFRIFIPIWLSLGGCPQSDFRTPMNGKALPSADGSGQDIEMT
jgi:hypothetical protein